MKKYLIISVLFLMAAGAVCQQITDNPYGAQYPASLRRAAKATPVSFSLKTYAVFDTSADGTKPFLNVDTTSNKEFMWLAPFNCKVDSLYFTFDGTDTLFNDDTTLVATTGKSHWFIRMISDTIGGTGIDTLRADSTVSASLGATTASKKRPYKKWLPRGGPDSANTTVLKGEYIRVKLSHAPACSSRATFHGTFVVTPADKAQ